MTARAATFTSSRCVAVLALHQLCTPLCATAFVPTLPLLLTQTLGHDVSVVGHLYAVFSTACLVGMLAVAPLMRYASPRAALLLALSLRSAAGALHLAGCARATAASLPLLFASRLAHGLSQSVLVLSAVWVGARVPPHERPRHIGMLGVAQTPGMLLGPSTGSLLAGALASPLAQAAAPGAVTLALGLLGIAATLVYFDDGTLLPQASEAEVTARVDRWLVGLCAWYMFASTMGLLAFESVLGLALFDMYSLEADAALVVWLPLALSALVGGIVMTLAQERLPLALLALLWNASFLVACGTTISWRDWAAAVSLPRFLAGACGVAAG